MGHHFGGAYMYFDAGRRAQKVAGMGTCLPEQRSRLHLGCPRRAKAVGSDTAKCVLPDHLYAKSYQLASRGRLPKDCAADTLRGWMACDIQGVAETSSQVRPASGLKLPARYFPIGRQICKWPRHHPALVTGVQLRSLGAPDKCTGRCSFSQSAQAKDSRAAGEFACNDSNSLTIDKAGVR